MVRVTQSIDFLYQHNFVSHVVFLVCSLLTATSLSKLVNDVTVIKFAISSFLLFITLATWKMTRMKINKGRPYISALQHFISVYSLDLVGKLMTWRLLKQTRQIENAQSNLLLQLLKRNSKTKFGVGHNFDQINTREDYIRTVPLSRISDYDEYIEMIKAGQQNMLTVEPVTSLGVTSGTSGKSSLIPTNRKIVSNFFLYGIAPLYHAMVKSFPQSKQLQKNLKLMFTPKWRYSDAGIRIGPTSSNPNDLKRVLHMYTTPIVAYEILDEKALTYIHLLFALNDEFLGMIETNFISSLSNALVILHEEWKNLVDDVEYGTLKKGLDIPSSVREKLEQQLKPNPDRAESLRQAYSQSQRGLLKRIWPDMHVILSADTGAFEIYRRLILDQEGFGLRTYSPIYAATEGIMGVNIWPLDDLRHYLLLPGSMFFEFIPIAQSMESDPKTLFMDQVEIGEVYELVITNLAGLYRYRIGDVVRIARRENECPVVEYMYRMGTILNVRGEKMSENYFYKCLAEVMNEEGLSLIDYCCVESPLYESALGKTRTSPPRYHVFFEAKARNHSVKAENSHLQSLAKELDRKLSSGNYVYSSFCGKGSIGEPVLHRVRDGGFLSLRYHLLDVTEAGANQLKIPRLLRREGAVCLLSELSGDL